MPMAIGEEFPWWGLGRNGTRAGVRRRLPGGPCGRLGPCDSGIALVIWWGPAEGKENGISLSIFHKCTEMDLSLKNS
jgi:hypothetical protein